MTLLSSPPFALPKTFDAVDAAIDANAAIADAVLAVALSTYGIPAENNDWRGKATPADMDKVRSTIRQLYRDWSAEGAAERAANFDPILSALDEAFAHVPLAKRGHLAVLVPGAGLGRLAFEICRAGYRVEGNEISYHQLMVSNWVLNNSREAGAFGLYPWALGFSNHVSRASQLQRVAVPDVVPGVVLDEASESLGSEVHAFERMSMSSGDFCVLYKGDEYREAFDAVTTCFFIDTAPNLIAYIETVLSCLKPGGVWINNGPLLWHFESGPQPGEKKGRGSLAQDNQGIGEAGSFELTDEEVVKLVEHMGFEIVQHTPLGPDTGYIQDPRSMLQNFYRPSFWVARKKEI